MHSFTPFKHIHLRKIDTSVSTTSLDKKTLSFRSTSSFNSSKSSSNSSSALHGLSELPKTLPVIVPKSEIKKPSIETAGKKWFDLPATPLTKEIQHDLFILKSRDVLDPTRHYKRDKKNKGVPKYFQIGTVIAPAQEFYSSRLTKKQRKRTIAEEILADTTTVHRLKQKAIEIQNEKAKGARPRRLTKKLYQQKKKKKGNHS